MYAPEEVYYRKPYSNFKYDYKQILSIKNVSTNFQGNLVIQINDKNTNPESVVGALKKRPELITNVSIKQKNLLLVSLSCENQIDKIINHFNMIRSTFNLEKLSSDEELAFRSKIDSREFSRKKTYHNQYQGLLSIHNFFNSQPLSYVPQTNLSSEPGIQMTTVNVPTSAESSPFSIENILRSQELSLTTQPKDTVIEGIDITSIVKNQLTTSNTASKSDFAAKEKKSSRTKKIHTESNTTPGELPNLGFVVLNEPENVTEQNPNDSVSNETVNALPYFVEQPNFDKFILDDGASAIAIMEPQNHHSIVVNEQNEFLNKTNFEEASSLFPSEESTIIKKPHHTYKYDYDEIFSPRNVSITNNGCLIIKFVPNYDYIASTIRNKKDFVIKVSYDRKKQSMAVLLKCENQINKIINCFNGLRFQFDVDKLTPEEERQLKSNRVDSIFIKKSSNLSQNTQSESIVSKQNHPMVETTSSTHFIKNQLRIPQAENTFIPMLQLEETVPENTPVEFGEQPNLDLFGLNSQELPPINQSRYSLFQNGTNGFLGSIELDRQPPLTSNEVDDENFAFTNIPWISEDGSSEQLNEDMFSLSDSFLFEEDNKFNTDEFEQLYKKQKLG